MTALPSRPARCLITGAGGFIGNSLCRRLDLHAPRSYRPLFRNAEAAAAFRARGLDAATGDLLSTQQVGAALDGCDAVIHLAHGDQGPRVTRQLVAEAARRQVKRFVHISTMAVHGPAPGPNAAHEATATVGRYNHDYSDSKAEQEEIVQAAHDRGDLRVVILRPTVVYGPAGHFVLQVIEQARSGVVSLFDEGSGICNAVYVDDVCDAIEAALTRPESDGQAFFINADHAITWGEFIRTFAAMVKPAPSFVSLSSEEALRFWAKHPPVQPPVGLVHRLASKLGRLFSAPPPPAPWPVLGRVQRETLQVEFSNQKAKALLGWAPQVSFPQGAELTRRWLTDTGKLS